MYYQNRQINLQKAEHIIVATDDLTLPYIRIKVLKHINFPNAADVFQNQFI